MRGMPDLNFLKETVVPLYVGNEDWLLPLLIHAQENSLCLDFYCGTCGAGPFKQAVRLIWSSDRQRFDKTFKYVNDTQFKQMSHGSFSAEDVDRLLTGLASMKSNSITQFPKYLPDDPFERDQILLSRIFDEPFISNPLMLLLYEIFWQTAELSLSEFDDPHEYMRRKLEKSFVFSFYWMMYMHWKHKKS